MMPALIGSIAPRAKGGLIAALGKGRAAITFDDKWEINITIERDILGNSDLRCPFLSHVRCDRAYLR
jgi:hypothetical protein